MTERILLVAAHPDDEVMGAGGVIARHRATGDEVVVLILGEGVTSRYDTREEGLLKGAEVMKKLRLEMQEAHRILGVNRTVTADFPDNRFDEVSLLDIVKVIQKVKKEVSPTSIYTHHHGDMNIDHRITFDAVITACRPTSKERIKRILSFEILSSTEWNAPYSDRAFLPNVFIEIEPYLEKKIQAMSCYKSELFEYPHPRSLEALRRNAELWGVKAGLACAEAFMLVRERADFKNS